MTIPKSIFAKWTTQKRSPLSICLVLMLLVSVSSSAEAQSYRNGLSLKVLDSFMLRFDTIIQTPLLPVPGSVRLTSMRGLFAPEFSIKDDQIIIKANSIPDSVVISYRMLAVDVHKSSPLLMASDIPVDDPVIVTRSDLSSRDGSVSDIWGSRELQYRGSFARGISLGNTQDLILNSSFNLQMEGDLGDGLNVRAAISDDNLPIQPEGNTQVLNEFDRVFIEIEKDRTSLIAGDYILASPSNYFMKYFKKLKGLSATSSFTPENKLHVHVRGSFAVSRGKFRRQMVETREGNQGPYRLSGNNGELFLQVLSGTEKIYADGRLLKRGEEFDYVIDYNRAEIRFTPNLIITANLRIIAEFEYAVQSYLRSLMATETTVESGKWTWGLNFYREQDSKTLSSNQELDSTDLRILRESGDGDAFRSSIFAPRAGLENNQIRYQLESGILYYAPLDTTDIVIANFTNVGTGMGDYIIDPGAGANGRVYKYAGPDMGSFDPVTRLIPPETRQMLTFTTRFDVRDSTFVRLEGAHSVFDLNRFSEVDKNDDAGFALNAAFEDFRTLHAKKSLRLATQINLELTDPNFTSLNPYRPVEFIRDWNLGAFDSTGHQVYLNSNVNVTSLYHSLGYGFSLFRNGSLFNGSKHLWKLESRQGSWRINAHGSYLESESLKHETSFFRPRAEIVKSWGDEKWHAGYYFEKEQNLVHPSGTDSLSSESFNYDLSRIYIQYTQHAGLRWRLGLSQRTDDRLDDAMLTRFTRSRSLEMSGRWTTPEFSDLSWQLIFRDYSVEEAFLERDSPSRSFVGKVEHRFNSGNNTLKVETYFESNAGQEPRLEFEYVRVQQGLGNYLWNDYNQDSIQQINEFVLAPYADLGEYRKITVFNNEFLGTQNLVLNQSIQFDPSQLFTNREKIWSRFNLVSRYRIIQKLYSDSQAGALVRFINFDFEDPAIVSNGASFDQNIFFNRGDPIFDAQLAWRLQDTRDVLVTGYERRTLNEWFVRGRYNMRSRTDLAIEMKYGQRTYDSENFNTQDYLIDFTQVVPRITHRPSRAFRISASYRFEHKINRIGEEEMAIIHDPGLEFTWRQAGQGNLQFSFNYILIGFTGAQNTPAEFEMLQGLRDGENVVWSVLYTRRVSSGIEISFNYNGRKSARLPVINLLSVQMRALF